MKRIFYVSCMTLLLMTSHSGAGTSDAVESEIETLESDVARAQNERDALLLKSGKGNADPAVQEKIEALEGRRKDLRERMKSLNIRPKATGHSEVTNGGGQRGTQPPRIETPRKEDMVLSGEGIQSEITYSKKAKSLKPTPVTAPAPDATVTPENSGLSEIRYPKKKK